MRFSWIPGLRRSALIVACMAILFTLAGTASAATYYCSPSGIDTRTAKQGRSRTTPFKTFERALAFVRDNDVIVALDGAYSFKGVRAPNYERYVDFTFRGLPSTLAKGLTIRSENKWGASLLGTVNLAGLKDLRFEGFRIKPAFTVAGYTSGLYVTGCCNPLIRDCFIESETQGGLFFADCDWVQAEWNVISFARSTSESRPSTGIGISQPRYQAGPDRPWGHWIRNNTIFGTAVGIGMYLDDGTLRLPPTDYDRVSLIENNFIFDLTPPTVPRFPFTAALEIVRFKNVRIRNNTLVRTFGFETTPMLLIRQSDRVYVYNNIIAASNQTPAIQLTDNKDTLIFANLIEGTEIPTDVVAMNYIGSPEFEPGTFIPSATSPAVDNAFDMGDHFFLDALGGPRFNGPLDIGAIER
jgi:hypothetical protein